MAASLNRHAKVCIGRCLHVLRGGRYGDRHYNLPKYREYVVLVPCVQSNADSLSSNQHSSSMILTCWHSKVKPRINQNKSNGLPWKFYSTSSSGHKGQEKRDDGAEKRKLLKAKKEARKQLNLERQRIKHEKKSERTYAVYTSATKSGEKKDTECPLPTAYSPEYVEAAWYEWWEKSGYFTPGSFGNKKSNKTFVVCLPPPNVTGTLHLGHALGNSIQDALVRWHRMCGDKVLWLPGSDHAGIATQVVVEKKILREQNKTRHDLGRNDFVKEVWKWKHEKGDAIKNQMRRLGSSLDWSRQYFTLDSEHSYAVNEAFIRLHDEGLIYRKKRLVNWSCTLKSAISDIEVDNISIDKKTFIKVPGYEKRIPFGQISSFAYPVEGSDEEVIVSTTRLETMLGDTAVAVHPDDDRFIHLHGKRLRHPLTGYSIPVICDKFVERDFGSGAVKITPAHDYNDNEVGDRHQLPFINILDDNGRMVNVPEQFQGKPRFAVRVEVQKALKDLNLFRGVEDHAMVLPTCSRSGDIIEPLLKDQWYVDCDDMAKSAVEAVKSGELGLIPDRYEDQWYHWLENIKDWCISRQLWWGHRIPVYRVTSKSGQPLPPGVEWISAHNEAEALKKAADKSGMQIQELVIKQDEDVLDTWFSSAIIPFSSLGWPKQTNGLAQFYPSHLLETASDILFFWVARMVMMGQKLTGQLPFRKVLLHSILRDSHGRKMSKSLGNIVDPMDVIHGITLDDLQEKLLSYNLSEAELKKAREGQQKDFPLGIAQCGADALHFTLCSYNFKNQFVNVAVSHIEANRRFCNKIWQAFRFSSQYWPQDYKPPTEIQIGESASATDRWILSELSEMVALCQKGFDSYNLNVATSAIYNFIWLKFCDVFLEYSKPVLSGSDPARVALVTDILHHCLSTSLRALTPFMPFLSEELYQRLPGVGLDLIPTVTLSPYPLPHQYPWKNNELAEDMAHIQTVINLILSLRKDFSLGKIQQDVTIIAHSDQMAEKMNNFKDTLQTLSRSATVTITTCDTKQEGCVKLDLPHSGTLYFKLQGLIDTNTELEQLQKRNDKLEKERLRLEERLSNVGMAEYAVAVDKDKLNKTRTEIDRLNRAIRSLQEMR